MDDSDNTNELFIAKISTSTVYWILKFKVCLWNTIPPAATQSKKVFLA